MTSKDERTAFMGYLSAFQYVGFAVSPIFGSIFSWWFKNSLLLPVGETRNFIDEFSAPAIFLFILCTVCIILLFKLFCEEERSPKLEQTKFETSGKENEMISINDEATFFGLSKVDRVTVGLCFLNMIVRANIGTFETLTLSYAMSHFEWSSQSAGVIIGLFGLAGAIILLCFK